MTRALFPIALFALSTAACTPKESPGTSSDPSREHYEARGQEPGWHLLIHGGRIDFTGQYGEKKIAVARPNPRPSINGRRYVTARLTVDITHSRCNDAMSGFGFEHQVMVTAEGETYDGCGGERKREWDM